MLSARVRHPRLREILRCPACGGVVQIAADTLLCENGGESYRMQDGVPVFLTEAAEVVPTEHVSNPLGAEYEAMLRSGDEFILNIGAGATGASYPNCIELEHKIFHHTDVVGDAHHLPFRDDVFDRVFAFNVFEHLRDPARAAREILRVLKPGGSVAIHTAFLQALHEPPFHFYNATEFGVREWFTPFQIDHCRVSPNFAPGMMLAFLMANVVEAVRAAALPWAAQIAISDTTIGEWAEFWAGKTEPPSGFDALQKLPPELQSRIAAGFELLARKPALA